MIIFVWNWFYNCLFIAKVIFNGLLKFKSFKRNRMVRWTLGNIEWRWDSKLWIIIAYLAASKTVIKPSIAFGSVSVTWGSHSKLAEQNILRTVKQISDVLRKGYDLYEEISGPLSGNAMSSARKYCSLHASGCSQKLQKLYEIQICTHMQSPLVFEL
jgi:hypothetical protein